MLPGCPVIVVAAADEDVAVVVIIAIGDCDAFNSSMMRS